MSVRRLATALVLTIALLASAPAYAVSSALVQNVDTSAYPKVTFTLAVSPDAVVKRGDVPQVSVAENGMTVKGTSVSSLETERGPIDVVLLMDVSGSMKGQPLEDARLAATRFIESMESSDRIALVAFASEPRVLQGFTSDRSALSGAIGSLSAGGETALYDGIVQSASVLAGSSASQRYIVVLSDGGDTMSINSADNAARAVAGTGVAVYAVALQSPEYNPATLETIAQASGGRMTAVNETASLAQAYEAIAQEMQLLYRVEFVSTSPNTPELDLQVTVGSGAGAIMTGAVARNPRFDATVPKGSGLESASPSALALVAALLAIFAAVSLLVLLVMLVMRRDRAALEQLRFYDQLRESAKSDAQNVDSGTVRGAVLNTLGTIAERQGFTGLVQRWLDSAGVVLRANEYIFFHVLGTIVSGVIVQLLGGSFAVVILVVLAAVAGPIVFLKLKADKRLRDFNEQLPDILDLIAGSLRSGWGIQQSLDLVVEEVGEPARTEFRRTQAEARLGLPIEEALERMADRIESDDLRWVVTAIAIQREVGGNLAEVLNTVSRTIRERSELKRTVAALTAEGKLSLRILVVLPFVVFAGMWLVNGEFMSNALSSPLGIAAYAFGLLLLGVGVYWLTSVMKIEV